MKYGMKLRERIFLGRASLYAKALGQERAMTLEDQEEVLGGLTQTARQGVI